MISKTKHWRHPLGCTCGCVEIIEDTWSVQEQEMHRPGRQEPSSGQDTQTSVGSSDPITAWGFLLFFFQKCRGDIPDILRVSKSGWPLRMALCIGILRHKSRGKKKKAKMKTPPMGNVRTQEFTIELGKEKELTHEWGNVSWWTKQVQDAGRVSFSFTQRLDVGNKANVN